MGAFVAASAVHVCASQRGASRQGPARLVASFAWSSGSPREGLHRPSPARGPVVAPPQAPTLGHLCRRRTRRRASARPAAHGPADIKRRLVVWALRGNRRRRQAGPATGALAGRHRPQEHQESTNAHATRDSRADMARPGSRHRPRERSCRHPRTQCGSPSSRSWGANPHGLWPAQLGAGRG
jgi:hypothetical protein